MTSTSDNTQRRDASASVQAQGEWVLRKAGSGEYIAEYARYRWVHAPDEILPELRWTCDQAKAKRWTDLAAVNVVRAELLKAGVEIELLAGGGRAVGTGA